MRRSTAVAEGRKLLESTVESDGAGEAASSPGVRSPLNGKPRRVHLGKALLEPIAFETPPEVSAREEELQAKVADLEKHVAALEKVHSEQSVDIQRLQNELEEAQAARRADARVFTSQKQLFAQQMAKERATLERLRQVHEEELTAVGEQGAQWRADAEVRVQQLQEQLEQQTVEIARLNALIPRGMFQRIASWF